MRSSKTIEPSLQWPCSIDQTDRHPHVVVLLTPARRPQRKVSLQTPEVMNRLAGARTCKASLVVGGVNSHTGRRQNFQSLPVPRVSCSLGGEEVRSIVKSPRLLGRNCTWHPSGEYVVVVGIHTIFCNGQQRSSEVSLCVDPI